ncbi:MAG: methyltransferase domain-containing protein [Planctomycetota bacterium]|nr:MAG: methyltransferase domain-containing protein [Planctomycetota bacterium]
MLRNHRLFWRQFRQEFQTTGAIAPSGRYLGRALARFVGASDGAQRVLEVGPGTGAVTEQIVRRLGPHDDFDLVELNEAFVRRLEERFASEPRFSAVAARTRVLHERLESLPAEVPYDVIVSGLPLNNFAVSEVEQIMQTFARLLRPGGVLSFFQYVAVRRAKSLVSNSAERDRLRGIARALDEVLHPHEIQRDCVLPNLPPAWVHHVRLPGAE